MIRCRLIAAPGILDRTRENAGQKDFRTRTVPLLSERATLRSVASPARPAAGTPSTAWLRRSDWTVLATGCLMFVKRGAALNRGLSLRLVILHAFLPG